MLAIIGTRPPPRMAGVTKKPSVRMNTSTAPAPKAGTVSGKDTRPKMVRRDAPSEADASRRRLATVSIGAHSGSNTGSASCRKECVKTCGSGWAPCHEKDKNKRMKQKETK